MGSQTGGLFLQGTQLHDEFAKSRNTEEAQAFLPAVPALRPEANPLDPQQVGMVAALAAQQELREAQGREIEQMIERGEITRAQGVAQAFSTDSKSFKTAASRTVRGQGGEFREEARQARDSLAELSQSLNRSTGVAGPFADALNIRFGEIRDADIIAENERIASGRGVRKPITDIRSQTRGGGAGASVTALGESSFKKTLLGG